jgi:hypothetical protein
MVSPNLDAEEYGAVPEASQEKTRRNRTLLVSTAIFLTMTAAIALAATNTSEQSSPIVDIAVDPDQKLEHLVQEFVKRGDTMPLAKMESNLDSWRHNPSTLLEFPEHQRIQVLVMHISFRLLQCLHAEQAHGVSGLGTHGCRRPQSVS